MKTAPLALYPLLKPGDEVLAAFTPLPSRRPVIRAVRITRVFVSAAGTLRWEGTASNPLPGGGGTETHRTQGDARQCVPLEGLLSSP